jgi:hypothetical protein
MNYQAIVKSEGPLYAAGLTIMQARNWGTSPRNAGLEILEHEQYQKIRKVWMRKECRKSQQTYENTINLEKETLRRVYRMALSRKTFKAIYRKYSIKQLWDHVTNHVNIWAGCEFNQQTTILIGSAIRSLEKKHIRERVIPKKDLPLYESMPLYTCSGELEATRMDTYRIRKLAKGKSSSTSRHELWRHSAHLNFARDGGGQAETQFLIRPELARIVCNLVTSLGSQSRNGGHIHINCGKDEAVGERVYSALRYNLTWLRWLVPYSRRSGHWSQMNTVCCSFNRAKSVKATALSANTWNRTGTVEMRLWGTSKKPEDWLGRRNIMQAIAKWSELKDVHSLNSYPLAEETTRIAWPEFVRWSAVNAPEALAYALRVIRKKCRSRSTPPKDKEACDLLWREFESTGIRVRGFRRRNPVVI